jgi:hypothetical protein
VMTASLVANLALAGSNVIQYKRRRSQGSEIRRQRERSDTLESVLRDDRANGPSEGEDARS